METIINYFETISSLHRSLILVAGISFFWILEGIIPLFNLKYEKGKHAAVNIFFTMTTILVNFPLAFLLLASSDWTAIHEFGLLYWLPTLPLWVEVLVAVMFLDLLGAWLAHFVEHKISLLWGFHLVHHTDMEVDTTSANRHHPFESVVRFLFTCFAVLIVGAPVAYIMLYQGLSVVFSQFNHANIKLPKKIDSVLSWFIVSPDMHKVHHHHKLPYTDTNYGNIFSIWDRMFGTFSRMPNTAIVFGVDTYSDPKQNRSIKALLCIPFNSYRKPDLSRVLKR
ncbi:MAG: sterol desaturase/sphingolipid hydroxylase (fatty acid hydroxylase superfamily) [Arcticibacterium sp.]